MHGMQEVSGSRPLISIFRNRSDFLGIKYKMKKALKEACLFLSMLLTFVL